MLDSFSQQSTRVRYQICTRCIMDSSDPDITLDANGVCNHCRYHDEHVKPVLERVHSAQGKRILDALMARIKERGKGREYDCVIGISGGVDSTYVAWLAKQHGLRPLAVHFDSGWNSELAVNNIEHIVKKLGIDLVTVVCDWDEMRDLQLSFFKASLANCDVPTDHAIPAVLRKVAARHGIKTMLSGNNLATEVSLPKAWGYYASDLTHVKAVQRAFGKKKLRRYPKLSLFARYFWYPFVKGIENVRILDFVPYHKDEAKKIIIDELGWRDYGGKHYESVFTRFFQSYYLPHKFGFDKRRSHLSSLILSGQITRDQALAEMQRPPDDEQRMADDKVFVAKKLGITLQEFDRILALPPRTHKNFRSQEWLLNTLIEVKQKILNRHI